MREPVKREIDGITFYLTPLGFGKGRRVFLRLAKVLTPILGGTNVADGASGDQIMAAIGNCIVQLNAEDLEWLDDQFAGDSAAYSLPETPGKRPFMTTAAQREDLFSGRFMTYAKWFAFACEVNFADFIAALGSAKGASAPEGSPATQP
jgi:hypothetical protein